MKRGALIFFLFFVTSNICLLGFQKNSPQDLDAILKKSAEYCEKVANLVLDVVCKEKITETIYKRRWLSSAFMRAREQRHPVISSDFKYAKGGKTIQNEYVYDYQLIRKDREIKEQRILIEENGGRRNEKNAKLKTRFVHEYMILGPYGLLRKERQPYHDYRIMEEKKLWGKDVIIIEAIPKPGFTSVHSWGKVWISKNDYSILRIEWDQGSIKGIENIQEDVIISTMTEYKFEKNGIRFPSLFTLEETYGKQKARYSQSKMKVIYEDYKFFTVKTDVSIK